MKTITDLVLMWTLKEKILLWLLFSTWLEIKTIFLKKKTFQNSELLTNQSAMEKISLSLAGPKSFLNQLKVVWCHKNTMPTEWADLFKTSVKPMTVHMPWLPIQLIAQKDRMEDQSMLRMAKVRPSSLVSIPVFTKLLSARIRTTSILHQQSMNMSLLNLFLQLCLILNHHSAEYQV